MRDLFTNAFPLDGKICLLLTGVSENGMKKMVSTSQKTVSTSRNKIIFKEIDFHKQKKRPNKRILFQVGRKSVSSSGNEEYV